MTAPQQLVNTDVLKRLPACLNCLGPTAAVLSHQGSVGSAGGPAGSGSGPGHLHGGPRLSAQPPPWHAPGGNEHRGFSSGQPAGKNTPPRFISLVIKTWMVTRLTCSGGLRGPRLPAGASAAGSLPVASGPRGGNAANTPTALDGAAAQYRVFSKRTQLLGQVIPRWWEGWRRSGSAQ